MHDGLLDAARRVTVPVLYLLCWDDEHVERTSAFTLFDAFATREKTLHAFPGEHARVPASEHEDTAGFLRRHLMR